MELANGRQVLLPRWIITTKTTELFSCLTRIGCPISPNLLSADFCRMKLGRYGPNASFTVSGEEEVLEAAETLCDGKKTISIG